MRFALLASAFLCCTTLFAADGAPRCAWEDGKLSFRFLANKSPKLAELLGPADNKTPGVFPIYTNAEENSAVVCVLPDKAALAEEIFRACKQEEASYCPAPKQNTPVDAAQLGAIQETLDSSKVDPAAVTYSKHIAPFLNKHCISCHQPGGIGRKGNTIYDFTSYEQVKKWSNTMLADMKRLRMPHGATWVPGTDPEDNVNCGDEKRFTSQRFPTNEELDSFRKWVAEIPKHQVGDPAAIPCPPPLPKRDDGWQTDPSMVMAQTRGTDGKGFKVPDMKPGEENDLFVNFPIDVPADPKGGIRYIKSVEFKPGNGGGRDAGNTSFPIDHHLHVFLDDTACQQAAGTLSEDRKAYIAERAKLAADDKAKTGSDGQSWTTRRVPYSIVGSWFPGSTPVVPGNNAGVEFRPCDKLVVQVHYTRYRNGVVDKSMVGIKFADPREKLTAIHSTRVEKTKKDPDPGVTEDPPGVAEIPAGATKFAMTLTRAFPTATKLYGIVPHQHQFGVRHRVTMVCPGKPDQCIFNGKWDFDNQGAHFLSKPIDIPAGCAMRTRCIFDLTVNDNDPNAAKGGEKFKPAGAIKFGPNAENEMCQSNYFTSVGEVK